MRLKPQFILLSSLIISIPILCAAFILIHTYMHSPNRYLIKGSAQLTKADFQLITENDFDNIQASLKMLPQGVEAALCRTTDYKILYSSIPEIETGKLMGREEILSFVTSTSDKYFYQFSKLPSTGFNTLLVTRLPLQRMTSTKGTKNYLKVLLAVILITSGSLVLLFFISRDIFIGLSKIEHSSSLLAEGKLDTPISTDTNTNRQNEFSSITNSLEKMRRELMEMQVSKNRFITGISHDLRTPVAVIRGYSEAIMDDVINDKKEIHNSMELIEQKTTQLEEMIDTLINFMKLNNTEIKEKLVKHSITELIQDFSKYASVTGKVFKRNVQTNIHLEKDIKIPLNEQLVHRSFENLLSNALRYTKENDLIEINASTMEIDGNNNIILQIRDTGSGIDKKDLDFIFDIFYRGTNSRQEEGMGIGLAVVKSIMDTHGWKISVESQKKKGSCFTITIPY